jgi:hypothetical protein
VKQLGTVLADAASHGWVNEADATRHAALAVPALQLIAVSYALVTSMSRRNCATRRATNG